MQNKCVTTIQAEELLSGSLDDERSSVIMAHVTGCAPCRRRVDRVRRNLAFADRLRGNLSRDHSGDVALSPPPPLHWPQVSSRYEVLDELGRGGMAVVYRAKQLNPPRLVALKVLSVAQTFDARHTKLLEREARVLALLNHPNLAAIYDAGRTDDGRPFLAMELIDGLPLNTYAQQNALPLRQRLALFLEVCAAVEHAHQRGVIHRDLKPSNVLVAGEGHVKVLDFGLARLLESSDAFREGSIDLEAGSIAGTLPYMSPEQVRAEHDRIDLRSDVYALGVLLYELLTGSLPYAVDRMNVAASARVICEQAPLKPGLRVAALRGDLETIMLKAIEKEPPARYASVSAMADDLRRYMHGEPISARPATLRYQLGKLIARHTAFFTAAAGAALLLTGLVAALTLQTLRLDMQRLEAIEAQWDEQAARIEAQRQSRIAGAVNAFLFDMLGSADPESGSGGTSPDELRVVDALAGAVKRAEEGFASQPDVEAGVRFTIGNTLRALGRLTEAAEQLEAALNIQRAIYPGDHADTALTLNKLGRCRHEMGQHDLAEEAYRQSLDMRKRLHGDVHAEVADVINNLAELASGRGRFDEAETLHRQALAIRQRVFGERDVSIATSMNNLGGVLYRKGDLAGAERCFRESLEMDTPLRGRDHPNIIATLGNLAVIVMSRDPAEAEPLLRDVLERRRRTLGEHHPLVGLDSFNLAMCAFRQHNLADARSHLHEALAVYSAAHGEAHPDIARVLHNLAMLEDQLGEATAEETLRRALAMREALLGPEHPDAISSQFALGRMLAKPADRTGRQDRWAEAEQLMRGGLERAERALPAEHPMLAMYRRMYEEMTAQEKP